MKPLSPVVETSNLLQGKYHLQLYKRFSEAGALVEAGFGLIKPQSEAKLKLRTRRAQTWNTKSSHLFVANTILEGDS